MKTRPVLNCESVKLDGDMILPTIFRAKVPGGWLLYSGCSDQVRAIQEWEQGRRKPEPAVRAYMLVIKNQPAAVRRALSAA